MRSKPDKDRLLPFAADSEQDPSLQLGERLAIAEPQPLSKEEENESLQRIFKGIHAPVQMQTALTIAAPPKLSEEEITESIWQVERRVLKAIRYQDAEPKRRSPWFAWGAGLSSAMATAICLLIFWPGKTPKLPDLKRQGVFTHQNSKKTASTESQFFAAGLKQTGKLSVAKLWDLKAYPRTNFKLTRPKNKILRVKLAKGGVHLSITPNTMNAVELHCEDIQVIVKGTVFSVERGEHWIRVEVWRGKVAVHSKKRKVLTLRAREGVRFVLNKGYPYPKDEYSLPPTSKSKPSNRLDWFAKKYNKIDFTYALDLLEMAKVSAKDKAHAVYKEAVNLQDLQRYKEAFQLLSTLLKHTKLSKQYERIILPRALTLCKQAKAAKGRCQELRRRYLRLTSPKQGAKKP